MKIFALCSLALLAGCLTADPADGTVLCNTGGGKQCPDGYDCVAGACYHHGNGPSVDLSVDQSVPDLAISDAAMSDGPATDGPPTDGPGNACADTVKDNAETDIDCGGTICPACATGKDCLVNSDCVSAICNSVTHKCVATQCLDGVKDGLESDVDCGGTSCPMCGTGRMCSANSDCASAVCGASRTCSASQCSDGAKDGAETDVDCGGGTCGKCANGRACLSGTDCTSTFCNATTKLCVATQCLDGAKDGAETDVDCGGGTCLGCAVGKMCVNGTDCASTTCSASSLCVSTQCSDLLKNGQETDIDCGGPVCSNCALGKMCLVGTDCSSNFCNAASKLCVGSQCLDGVRDGSETDVDCGGGICAARCATGKACAVGGDCASGFCNGTSHLCVATSCGDGIKDGTETDIDCGGSCSRCATGQGCGIGADCSSGFCNATSKLCVATQCLDGTKDGAETDIDCGGGSCVACGLGRMCLAGGDCGSTFCNASSKTCVANQCLDGTKDGAETDIDCGGGSCGLCGLGKMCLAGGDCASTFCNASSKTCVANQCSDGVKNGAETDIDCGGASCGKCGNGKMCLGGADCTSTFCNASSRTCVANQCLDGVKNGAETDVDCGGGSCGKCALGRMCALGSDCTSAFCNAGTKVCVASQCLDGVKNGSETDVDCGGSCGGCGQGKTCIAAADCANNQCVNSVCCASASCGTCQGCNVGGFVGNCHAVLGDGTPDPQGGCQASASQCQAGGCGDNTGACKPAPSNTVCATGCNNTCAPCNSGNNCLGQCTGSASTQFCSGTSTGCTGATSNTACPGGLICNSSGACFNSCRWSGDCAIGQHCAGGACAPEVPVGGACSGNPPDQCVDGPGLGVAQCVGSPGTCSTCELGTCPAQTPHCNGAAGGCGPCTMNIDCVFAGNGSACNVGTGACTCSVDADCTGAGHPVCSNGSCACGQGNISCLPGQGCTTNDVFGICKMVAGQVCEFGFQCVSGTCALGLCATAPAGTPCRFSSECSSASCNANGAGKYVCM